MKTERICPFRRSRIPFKSFKCDPKCGLMVETGPFTISCAFVVIGVQLNNIDQTLERKK